MATPADIRKIQNDQLIAKEKELRFIAENVEALIETMWLKGKESRIGHDDRDAYDLWRGSNIDFDLRRTNCRGTVYHIVEAQAWLQIDLEEVA